MLNAESSSPASLRDSSGWSAWLRTRDPQMRCCAFVVGACLNARDRALSAGTRVLSFSWSRRSSASALRTTCSTGSSWCKATSWSTWRGYWNAWRDTCTNGLGWFTFASSRLGLCNSGGTSDCAFLGRAGNVL
ncbi:unnamed protein product [Prorocentrum cordatum]|nr:unnamed protein product [Polarella glacialis]